MLAEIQNQSTLIWQVKKQLPKAVQKQLDIKYTDWEKFVKAIKEMNTMKLKQEREDIEERRKQDKEREQKLTQKVEAVKQVATADLTAQLQCLTIGQVSLSHTQPGTNV
ncbi:hypothetical protein M404DRAFT_25599 [Pisolithus tinctorius Marx 270]|uniref:Uncharacterized protein n=1 Tax=Pisolithus tinctorius Marx 270 TaxID=870435 RepID=A0A0C3J8W7_PISTI|nr:hypothetical protein M404DRAFT_25599 [Pisolithus tinctorius Marx 270]